VRCAEGRASSVGAMGPCELCAAGRYIDWWLLQSSGGEGVCGALGGVGGSGLVACAGACVPRRSCHGSNGWCAACDGGTYAARGSGQCAECAAGAADQDNDPATPCQACAAGQAAHPARRGAALHDPGGFNATHSRCQTCAAGRFSPRNGTVAPCAWCPRGTTAARMGALGCVNCTAGRADTDGAGATPCVVCEEGSIAAVARARACVACPRGEWSDLEGSRCYTDPDPYRHFTALDYFMEFAFVPLVLLAGAGVLYKLLEKCLPACWKRCDLPPMRSCTPKWVHTAVYALGVSDIQPEATQKEQPHSPGSSPRVARRIGALPPPPPRRWTKALRRENALRMGRRWRRQARRLALVNHDCRLPALRAAAGPTVGLDLSPQRQKQRTQLVVPSVSPEKLQEHRLVKRVAVGAQQREEARRPALHRDLRWAGRFHLGCGPF
jgi:hypothetical protein